MIRSVRGFIFLSFMLSWLAVPSAYSKPADIANNLVRYSNGKFKPVSGMYLTSAKYVAYYYSAYWCPPCREFAPELVTFYNQMKATHGDAFELIFISGDHSEWQMALSMGKHHVPWPALDFKKRNSNTVVKHAAQGMPYLVVLDKMGNEILGKGTEDWIHPEDLLPRIKQLPL
ncbi:MAG: thioredoxin-like domain-containing protein [Candidatus Methylacidiphilales bacterium]